MSMKDLMQTEDIAGHLEHFSLRHTNGIGLLTIEHGKVNALSASVQAELSLAFELVDSTSAVRVVIFTGAGSRAFCAGADIKSMTEDPDALEKIYRNGQKGLQGMINCRIPVIGAINGPALGGGLTLASCCDFLIAADNAVFGLPEIKVGLLGGAKAASRLLPWPVVRWMQYSGENIDAHTAENYGAVIRVVEAEDLLSTCMEYAAQIADKMPSGIEYAKDNINAIQDMDLWDAMAYEQKRTQALAATEDAIELKKTFAEGRPR